MTSHSTGEATSSVLDIRAGVGEVKLMSIRDNASRRGYTQTQWFMKFWKLFPIDLFGELAWEKREMLVLIKLRRAVLVVGTLERAFSELKTETSREKLEMAKQEVEILRASLPRGDVYRYIVFFGIYLWFVFSMGKAHKVLNAMIEDLWGGEHWASHWYLLRFRPFATVIWKWGEPLWGSPILLCLSSALILAALWFVQKELQRRHAHLLMNFAIIVSLLLFFVFIGSAFRLLELPLGI